MCCKKDARDCRRPQDMKEQPSRCSVEQVRKCHGEVKEHRCVGGQAGRKR